MNLEDLKKFMKEVGWGILATPQEFSCGKFKRLRGYASEAETPQGFARLRSGQIQFSICDSETGSALRSVCRLSF